MPPPVVLPRGKSSIVPPREELEDSNPELARQRIVRVSAAHPGAEISSFIIEVDREKGSRRQDTDAGIPRAVCSKLLRTREVQETEGHRHIRSRYVLR